MRHEILKQRKRANHLDIELGKLQARRQSSTVFQRLLELVRVLRFKFVGAMCHRQPVSWDQVLYIRNEDPISGCQIGTGCPILHAR
jgi:hypothetical protein